MFNHVKAVIHRVIVLGCSASALLGFSLVALVSFHPLYALMFAATAGVPLWFLFKG
jgi:hypothetical protein